MNVDPRSVAYRFAGFELDPACRSLRSTENGQTIALTAKVFDTLVYLIEHRGQLVEKRALLEAVWPNVIVEEANLPQTISVLRRALADDPRTHRLIATVPGRGYQFVAPVETTAPEPVDRTEVEAAAAISRKPASRPEPATVLPAVRTGGRAHTHQPRFARYLMTTVLAAGLATGLYLFWSRDTDARWLREQAIPEIEAHLQTGDFEAAYAVAKQADARVPGASELDELWPRLSWLATIPSDPPGAIVFRRAYDATDAEWEELGRTPLEGIRIPFGLSQLRVELEGHVPLLRAIGGGVLVGAVLSARQPTAIDANINVVAPETFKLDPTETFPEGKVRVPGWQQAFDGELVQLRDFFLGRYEVTNAEFKAFVDAGGYRNATYWEPVVKNGAVIPWQEAIQRFTDRTGRLGPSTWEAGDYPEGQEDFPVSGVSWYEAAAYARFVGQELPTAHHWQRGLALATLPWLFPASNFGGVGPIAVGQSRAISHTGAFDMLGNLREWTRTARGDQRLILGGAWNDAYYVTHRNQATAAPLDRSPSNGLRLAITEDEPAVAALARAPVSVPPAPVESQPVSDEVYEAYGRMFEYERAALNAVVDETETTRTWIRQRISFDAAYNGERMVVYLYLPRRGAPPYQTVIYWPGSHAFNLASIDEYSMYLDFIVKDGRAVAFPVYKGTFERGDRSSIPMVETIAYRDNAVDGVKDLRRTIDYLEGRPDIDRNAVALFGHSWGALNGATALAQEPRIKSAIIYVGFLSSVPMKPEVDPVNALPRVNVPVLMLSGEFDSIVPLESARRYFEVIGTPESDKKFLIAPGGHFVPRDLLIRETLDWLNAHLGPPLN